MCGRAWTRISARTCTFGSWSFMAVLAFGRMSRAFYPSRPGRPTASSAALAEDGRDDDEEPPGHEGEAAGRSGHREEAGAGARPAGEVAAEQRQPDRHGEGGEGRDALREHAAGERGDAEKCRGVDEEEARRGVEV